MIEVWPEPATTASVGMRWITMDFPAEPSPNTRPTPPPATRTSSFPRNLRMLVERTNSCVLPSAIRVKVPVTRLLTHVVHFDSPITYATECFKNVLDRSS